VEGASGADRPRYGLGRHPGPTPDTNAVERTLRHGGNPKAGEDPGGILGAPPFREALVARSLLQPLIAGRQANLPVEDHSCTNSLDDGPGLGGGPGAQRSGLRHKSGARRGRRSDSAEAAALHHQAEVLHRPLDLLVRVLEELGDQLPGLAPGRVVLEGDLDVGPAAAVVEADRAGVVDLAVADAAPGDAGWGGPRRSRRPTPPTCRAAPTLSSGWSLGR
jgi:hypothetical protein